MYRLLIFWLLFPGFNANAFETATNLLFDKHESGTILHSLPKTKQTDRNNTSDFHATATSPLAFTVTAQIRELGGVAHLEWIAPGVLTDGFYYVERLDVNATPPATWVEVQKLPFSTLQYDDTISFPYCTKTDFSYRIRCESTLTGITYSNHTSSLELFDNTDPADVKNVLVSISKLTGNPVITWTPLAGDDIRRYIFQRYNGTLPYKAFDSIPPGSSKYTDAIDACNKSYSYVIRARDMCNRSSAPAYDTLMNRTIKLDVSVPGICEKVAKLAWNTYNGMPGGLGGYTIFRQDAMGAIVKYDSKTTTFTDNSSFTKGQTYLYSVKAYSNNGADSSASCQATWQYNADITPDIEIKQVSVEEDRYVRVGYHFSPSGTISKLVLERSDDGMDFNPIDSLQSSGIFSVPADFYFDDTTAAVHKQSYYYRLTEYDNCGGMATVQPASRSIFMNGSSQQTQNILNWNNYETWAQGIMSYKVYRILNLDPATITMIGDLPATDNSFTDLLSGVDPTKTACYWVVANENTTAAFSKSNTVCITKEAVLFMPNAFNPESAKNTYLRPVPVPLFVDALSFKMTVFSRWGQQIFETTNMMVGWDGTINGQSAPAGLYSYIITYKSNDGKEFKKRGTATLLR